LIRLHSARKSSGEYDHIPLKPFSEHSHVIAIATTGNVFLAEIVKGGVDPVNDERFKK
jgi:peptidyl-prolyl cis-trans isomerase-like protein 2